MDARAPAPVKERGVVFLACSVLAILAGRQTMTRRVLPPVLQDQFEKAGEAILKRQPHQRGIGWEAGDHLYVKEAWRTCAGLDDKAPFEIGEACADAGYSKPWGPVEYVADGARRAWTKSDWPTEEAGRLRSAQHMPRWASRIELHVTEVRVERLQDISEDDAKAEGLKCMSKDGGRVWKWGIPDQDGWPGEDDHGWPWHLWCVGHRPAYGAYWNKLHGREAWGRNPFVAVIRFERALAAGWTPVLISA